MAASYNNIALGVKEQMEEVFFGLLGEKSVWEKNILKLNKSAKLIFDTLEYLQKHLLPHLLSYDLHYNAHKFDIVKKRLKNAKSNLPIIILFVHCAMLDFLPLMPLW